MPLLRCRHWAAVRQPLAQMGAGWWYGGDAGLLNPAGLPIHRFGLLDGAINSRGETVFADQVESDPEWGPALAGLERAIGRYTRSNRVRTMTRGDPVEISNKKPAPGPRGMCTRS
ncbi:MAG: hypothetical protein FJ077_01640 [Cyanobacteria bacterium K_DeepCast_35m_m2_023]|nr:hypothetical protein [Cyanobacteria bacterium K_DeepCast_35m_m2_023]